MSELLNSRLLNSLFQHHLHLLEFVAAVVEGVVNLYVSCTFEEYAAVVPMERSIVLIVTDSVALPQQAVDGLGIEERVIEALKLIIHDADSVLLTAMEILFLSVEVGYFGIDADDSIGELEHAGE